MRIGEVARRSGVSVRALRYYEQQGLLTSRRTSGGQRDYADDAVGRVRFFQQLYAAGLSSRRIAELLPCVDTGTTTAAQRAMLDDERARIAERISALHTALDRLDDLIVAADARRG
ncbi:MerR family transcriptional regulator [Jiangella alba]|uniref:DNA-binding transcriptional regulator, MerR family n=1 Tax=Jiangella alba TaxID=561176 RepID=A0A1H5KS92_9ACTN|nr:MerR family transcriptional regulator [Jiangella alba]SEE67633.1 DNA-binding transcriptional regulator, MerR family [Jiangella alba]